MQNKRDYNNKLNAHGFWVTHYNDNSLAWKAYFVDGKALGFLQFNYNGDDVGRKTYFAR